MQEIKYPIPPLYFICYNINNHGDKYPTSHGYVLSTQVMCSGLEYIETFENEEEYLSKLNEFSIELDTYCVLDDLSSLLIL